MEETKSCKGVGGHPPTPIIDGKKRCGRCGESKEVAVNFTRSSRNPTGFGTRCKACDNELYEAKKADPAFVERRRETARAWNSDPKNKEARALSKAKSDKKNRPKIREHWNARMKSDMQFRLSIQLRVRLADAMRRLLRGKKPQEHTSAVRDLGCSIQDLMRRLELQFKPRMTWLNYGKWHIDHIKALANFDLTDSEQVKLACHFSNLQPMWAAENISKGDRPAISMRFNLLRA